jgi:hypothetical protein
VANAAHTLHAHLIADPVCSHVETIVETPDTSLHDQFECLFGIVDDVPLLEG